MEILIEVLEVLEERSVVNKINRNHFERFMYIYNTFNANLASIL